MNDGSGASLPFFGLPRLWPWLRPNRRLILVMILTCILGGAADFIIPLFQQYALNHFVVPGTLKGIGLFTLVYVLTIAGQTAANYVSAYDACAVELYVGRDLKRAAFDHLQTLSFSYFNHNSVGYIHARVMSDTDRIGARVSWSVMDLVWNIAYVLGAVVIMLRLNRRLALLVLSVLPVLVPLASFFQKKLVDCNRRVRETNSRITAAFNEGIVGAPTAKTLVIGDKLTGEFDTLTGEMRRISVSTGHCRALFLSVTAMAATTALALVLQRGGVLTAEGAIRLGTFSVFMTYAQTMVDPIQSTIEDISELIGVQVNIERLTTLLATESEVRDTPEVIERYGDSFHPKKENWEELRGDVEFEDVTFRYSDGDTDVLEHFSLKVPQGTNVAIVGETGAGKSTLVNLVCRFFEPTAGRILIDGRDVRERSQLWLHSHIGYVLQTPHLFSGTVLENLRYGREEASMEEIEAAVRAVSAERIIERLPEGYNSQVGEGGNSLSTGEKQLLSFARAILADPAIFVLDEATSSVDTETEQLIQSAIERLMCGRTSFVIAHRLSTIRRADVILVVDGGKIIERGSHAELMARRGAYWRLYTRQFREERLQESFESAEREEKA